MDKLSVVYITLNAEPYLAESLAMSRQLSDDIVIVDSGSTDNTLSIAQSMNCRLIKQDWLGFAAQKQLAIDSAKWDWVLFLDADEILTQAVVNEIQEKLSNDLSTGLSTVAYSIPRQNWFQNKWIQHGSWWPDSVVRLVNRSFGRIKPVPVHECWETTGKVDCLVHPIKHYSYRNYAELIHKANQYSDLAAAHLYTQKKQCASWSPLLHAVAAFLRLFVLKQGFRDGIEGAAIAYTAALASFMKYAKLQELWRNSKKS